MYSVTITNTSGSTLVAGSLPATLSWVGDIVNGGSVVVALNDDDYTNPIATTGFTLKNMLQVMVQKGTITVAAVQIGGTDRDVVSNAIVKEV